LLFSSAIKQENERREIDYSLQLPRVDTV